MQFNELIDDPQNEYIKEGLIRHRNLLINQEELLKKLEVENG